ncbi:MAG: DNA mismatch repair protein MutS, partial [Hyphomicrobiales bacterium]|nr:DNA mismatch repair protein MutS [Hyphomicrobiales bacterium]
ELAAAADALDDPAPGLEAAIAGAIAEEAPLDVAAGGFVREGFDAALDDHRALRDDAKRVIAGLQRRYSDLVGARQLRVKHNNFLGYFVEVPAATGEAMLRGPHAGEFVHRQTMADAMRFSTAELADLQSRIAAAADLALAAERAHFERLRETALALRAGLRRAAEALAALDVHAGFAELADGGDWTRPAVDASLAFKVEGGRHPVVAAALAKRGEPFVANDCALSSPDDEEARLALVTGPNMAGKSTYLRQNALIAVIAQAGGFVPARSARIGIVDRLFSRVGASDDLARGRSTFMVEMVETAAILNQATARSLVVLDEIGRGTATWDGLSIAWACIEHLDAANRCRTLFATHFHELTKLSETSPRIVNLTMRVKEWRGGVAFLHEVGPGAADRSYGVQVARLAGLPAKVVARAKDLLATLERADRGAAAGPLSADLPLFRAAPTPEVAPARDPLREALDAVEPDRLSPREALDALYRLKAAAEDGP